MVDSRPTPLSPLPPAVATLAQTLTRHLRGGGYAEGDRYLSVRQIARRFAVSSLTAHRAIKHLSASGLIELRQGSGAYVAGTLAKPRRARVVSVFLREDPVLRQRFLLDGLQLGLIEALPAAVVMQIHVVPRHQALEYLAEATAQSQPTDAAVMVRAGRVVRQFFQRQRMAAVVIGTREDDLTLPSVGHDQVKLGAAVAERLMQEGRRQVLLAMQTEWDLGDNLVVESLQQSLASAARRVELRVQSIPPEPELAVPLLHRQLTSLGPGSALVCRSGQMALQAAELAAKARIAVPDRLRLVALGCDALSRGRRVLPITAPRDDDRAVGQFAGNVLVDLWKRPRRRGEQVFLPQPLDDWPPSPRTGH